MEGDTRGETHMYVTMTMQRQMDSFRPLQEC
jgi:hypothetical protein